MNPVGSFNILAGEFNTFLHMYKRLLEKLNQGGEKVLAFDFAKFKSCWFLFRPNVGEQMGHQAVKLQLQID